MADLGTDVRYIKGVGEQKAKALEKLGIRTLQDLISYFPRAYDDRRGIVKIKDLQDGESACVEAMVAATPTLSRIRKGLELVKLRAVDESGTLDITFFNQAYRKTSLIPGETYTFYGKAEGNLLRKTMTNPVGAYRADRSHLPPHRRYQPTDADPGHGAGACRLPESAGGPPAR